MKWKQGKSLPGRFQSKTMICLTMNMNAELGLLIHSSHSSVSKQVGLPPDTSEADLLANAPHPVLRTLKGSTGESVRLISSLQNDFFI